ncbi:YoaK family protein [uncultured Parasphingorhabdus sp.]|uniref:YoaK family protein n=1 Tax=uncultured Parasphingorhabdus sp. TaxID=2709694 RepID=UPI0030DC9236|tara:strand:- start:24274 stop:24987 length:714 start_codon:yes stop_codon:yes gene_type:complete
MKNAAQTTPPLAQLLLILSFTTGLVDAISVLGLGKVFTANMTGNIVFLGFAVADAPGFSVAPYLLAIACFLIGAVAAGLAGSRLKPGPLRRWLNLSAVIEAALLWIAAAVAIGFDVAAQETKIQLYAIIALTAIAMGYRNGTIRQLKIPDLTTTVLTLTLTGLAADSRIAGGSNPNWLRRCAAVLCIFAGAATGATLVLIYGLAIPLALTGMIILCSTLLFSVHPKSGQSGFTEPRG